MTAVPSSAPSAHPHDDGAAGQRPEVDADDVRPGAGRLCSRRSLRLHGAIVNAHTKWRQAHRGLVRPAGRDARSSSPAGLRCSTRPARRAPAARRATGAARGRSSSGPAGFRCSTRPARRAPAARGATGAARGTKQQRPGGLPVLDTPGAPSTSRPQGDRCLSRPLRSTAATSARGRAGSRPCRRGRSASRHPGRCRVSADTSTWPARPRAPPGSTGRTPSRSPRSCHAAPGTPAEPTRSARPGSRRPLPARAQPRTDRRAQALR